MNRWMLRALLVGAVVAAACTKPNPAYCASDEECEFAATPFCDVNGEFSEPANTCIARPPGCPIERCGCDPGATRCEGDDLHTCNNDGRSETTVTCHLGCSDSLKRCLTFAPSNDLGPALIAAAMEGDVVLPAGVQIDTATGMITTPSGPVVTVASMLVSQGATSIRVFMGRSLTINDANVLGPHAFAFAASGPIVVKGRVDASAAHITGGPGAQESPATCVGMDSRETTCNGTACAPGAGGAGNATSGGTGGFAFTPGSAGGIAITASTPLVGGCRGGNLLNALGQLLVTRGGAGGGALQLVSGESISFSEFGFVDVGGGGGQANAGGGSGGLLVLEAPRVQLNGDTTGITANGGAGGGCSTNGPDSSPTATAAIAPQCGQQTPGDGGTGTTLATNGIVCSACIISGSRHYGGGGGAVGRLRVATRDGSFDKINLPIVSVVETAAVLLAQ